QAGPYRGGKRSLSSALELKSVTWTVNSLRSMAGKTRYPHIHANAQRFQCRGSRSPLGIGTVKMWCHGQQVSNLCRIGKIDGVTQCRAVACTDNALWNRIAFPARRLGLGIDDFA